MREKHNFYQNGQNGNEKHNSKPLQYREEKM